MFDRIQTCTAALRDQNEQRDLDTTVLQQEQTYDRRLLDVYGYPYQEDIGPGKLYPEGYLGPDTEHYRYINRYDYFGRVPLDTAQIQTSLIVPSIGQNNGLRTIPPGELMPRPPSSNPELAIEDILSFVSTDYAARYARLKEQYAEKISKARLTRRDVESLGIADLSSFYNEVFSAYDSIEAAVFGAVSSAVAWFDGMISTPVDQVDNFISQWVGSTGPPLQSLSLKIPNITYATNQLTFWVGNEGLPTKPASYVSSRRAEGEIQIALSQYVLALREATAAIADSRTAFDKVRGADEVFRNKIGAEISAYYSSLNALDQMNSLEQIMAIVNKAKALVEKVYADGMELYEAAKEAIPSIAGMSVDIGAAVRGPLRAAKAAANMATTVQKIANGEQITATQADLERSKKVLELNATALGIGKESAELAIKVVTAAQDYINSLDKLDVALQKAETFRMQY